MAKTSKGWASAFGIGNEVQARGPADGIQSIYGPSSLSPGSYRSIRGDLQNKLSEMLGLSADSYDELQGLYNEIGNAAKMAGGLEDSPGLGANSPYSQTQGKLTDSLKRYTDLLGQFDIAFQAGKDKVAATAAAHEQRLADLEGQRATAEAATRRNQAWAGNVNIQNRQNENLPDTVTAGTGDSGGDGDGDIGGKPRKRRGALSSNLGINA